VIKLLYILCKRFTHIAESTLSKKLFDIPVRIRDVTYQTSLGGNNDVIYKLFPPRESLVSDILAGDGNIEKKFLRCGKLRANSRESLLRLLLYLNYYRQVTILPTILSFE
jgi:hypothetical protein